MNMKMPFALLLGAPRPIAMVVALLGACILPTSAAAGAASGPQAHGSELVQQLMQAQTRPPEPRNVDRVTGCRFFFPLPDQSEPARWTGNCLDGLADGDGALTSAHGAFFLGTFRRGQPFEGHGAVPMQWHDGSYSMVTYAAAPGKIFIRQALPPMPRDSMAVVAASAIAGDWVVTPLDAQNCHLDDRITLDGRRVMLAGDARQEEGLTVYRDGRDPNIYRVLSTVLARAGQDPCLPANATGSSQVFFVRFEDADHAALCVGADLSRCFARWDRSSNPGASNGADASVDRKGAP